MFEFVRNMLLRNIPLKLISIALAVLVWYYIGQEITDKVDLAVRFQVNLPAHTEWKIHSRDVWDIQVTLRGSYSDIQRLRAFWTLSGVYTITPESLQSEEDEIVFHLPISDVEFISFQPQTVHVRLLRTAEKTLRVVPAVNGAPEEGYAMEGDPRATPEVVTVRGPQLVLKKLDEIPTFAVHLTGRTSSFTEKKRVIRRVDEYDIECDELVTLEVTIREKPGKKPIQNVRVRLTFPTGFPHQDYRVTPGLDTLGVTVEGPRFLLETIDASRVRIYADVAEVKDPLEEGKSRDENAPLRAEILGFEAGDRSRLKIDLGREDILYKLERIQKE